MYIYVCIIINKKKILKKIIKIIMIIMIMRIIMIIMYIVNIVKEIAIAISYQY